MGATDPSLPEHQHHAAQSHSLSLRKNHIEIAASFQSVN